jgi:hypothetical protein
MNKQQWEEELKLQEDMDKEQYDDYSPVEVDYAPNS